MKIVMMGAGAMGSLFGGLLAYSGEEVWLVDIRRETVDLLNAVGLTYEKEGKIQLIGANATTDVKSIGKADLVISLSRRITRKRRFQTLSAWNIPIPSSSRFRTDLETRKRFASRSTPRR